MKGIVSNLVYLVHFTNFKIFNIINDDVRSNLTQINLPFFTSVAGFHPSDLQTRYDFRCLSVYWHDSGGGKGDLAWRLTECSQTAGYICKKRAQGKLYNCTFLMFTVPQGNVT